ncbi:hypothetical protein THRCLA_20789 [Thraustotheca clavata]|uniref:HMG box domain-containing protein n=1 Tax=Thraustotheca clavata TaxID=74557 RepID=A0A1W0A3Q1_9STRA|nr:hypothetical protein THRCLA_20789 [Thraustotheca clavata]
MSTRTRRTTAKVQRFDPVSGGDASPSVSEESEEEVPKKKKAAKRGPKAKAAGKKKGKENSDGKPKEKRPPSAYFLFMAEERPTVKSEFPDYGIKEIAVELGSRWKSLGDAKKSKFQDEAKKLSDAYKARKEEAANNSE